MARFSILRKGGTGGSSRKGVNLDFDPFIEALRELAEAGASASAEVTPVIAEILVSAVLEVFEKEGAVPGGSQWEELAESTKAKRRGSGPYKILQDTGVLVGSITPWSEALVAEAFTNVPYAGYHVSQRARSKLPMRDFTLIDFDGAQREAADVVLAQLMQSAAE